MSSDALGARAGDVLVLVRHAGAVRGDHPRAEDRMSTSPAPTAWC